MHEVSRRKAGQLREWEECRPAPVEKRKRWWWEGLVISQRVVEGNPYQSPERKELPVEEFGKLLDASKHN